MLCRGSVLALPPKRAHAIRCARGRIMLHKGGEPKCPKYALKTIAGDIQLIATGDTEHATKAMT